MWRSIKRLMWKQFVRMLAVAQNDRVQFLNINRYTWSRSSVVLRD